MRKLDLTGQRYSRLVVLEEAGRTNQGSMKWRCRCDCGTETVVAVGNLRSGHTKSCGCYHRECMAKIGREFGGRHRPLPRIKHGHAETNNHSATYGAWKAMIQRCTNPNAAGYEYYGGKGIKVCDRWHDFRNFLEDMGERPEGTTNGRYGDVGNYEPGNCAWMTPGEQGRNKRVSL